jgi:hypothetical protein
MNANYIPYLKIRKYQYDVDRAIAECARPQSAEACAYC